MSRKTDRRRTATLAALYARIPRIVCRGFCAVACGPIPLSTFEAEQVRRADPGRRLPMIRKDASCVYLNAAKRCDVYAARPLICRAWGVIKRLSCMWGCVPDRWLSDREFLDLAQAIERLGGATVVTAPNGLLPGSSFLELGASRFPDEVAEALAEQARALRAICGGFVVGVVPSAEPGMIDADREPTE
jgi:hypothetical protein